jgi:carbamoyl-phosphate synthase large subunit
MLMIILVTAIGSMSGPFVIETIKKMNMVVVGVDIYPKEWVATSKEVSFFHQVPQVFDSKLYQQKILGLCEHYKINMIIPLTDAEVDHYSNYKDIFAKKGIIVAISKKEVIQLLRNKLKVFDTFKDTKIRVIPTYTPKDYIVDCGIFPCVAKKIDGRSSEGLFILEEKNDINKSLFKKNNYIFQPLIKGDIIAVDVLKYSDEKSIYIARKELVRTKNGAGISVEIIDDKKLFHAVRNFCDLVDFEGCINIEFIKRNSTYFLMDINPRFSAGVAFSNIAGYNFVENHILYFWGRLVKGLNNVKLGTIITRKYVEVIV